MFANLSSIDHTMLLNKEKVYLYITDFINPIYSNLHSLALVYTQTPHEPQDLFIQLRFTTTTCHCCHPLLTGARGATRGCQCGFRLMWGRRLGSVAGHPPVWHDLWDCVALFRVEHEHATNKVFAFWKIRNEVFLYWKIWKMRCAHCVEFFF